MKKSLLLIFTLSIFSIFSLNQQNVYASSEEKELIELFETKKAIKLQSQYGEGWIVPAEVKVYKNTSSPSEEYTQILTFDTQEAVAYSDLDITNSDSLLSKLFLKKINAASHSNSTTDWDSSYSVKGTVTVNYVSDSNGYIKINTVSGSYSVSDSVAKVTAQSIIYANTGLNVSPTQRNVVSKGTSPSWTINTGYTKYANPYSMAIGGAQNRLTITRNNSSWYLYVSNIVYQSGGASFGSR